MKKLLKLLACTFLFLSFFNLHQTALAQNPASGPYATLVAAADAITLTAVQTTSDANYVANHTSGNGSSNQMTARLDAIESSLSQIEQHMAQAMSLIHLLGEPGLYEEIHEVAEAFESAEAAYGRCINAHSSGLPIPVEAATELQAALTALRDASPCIRREIQEIQ